MTSDRNSGLQHANAAPALSRWRCVIRSPLLRRVSAIVFALYLLKGLAWMGLAWWLWR